MSYPSQDKIWKGKNNMYKNKPLTIIIKNVTILFKD